MEPEKGRGRQFSSSSSLKSWEEYLRKNGKRATEASYARHVAKFKKQVLGERDHQEADKQEVRPNDATNTCFVNPRLA